MIAFILRCRSCWRVQSILLEAPYSNFDLLSGLIVFWIGAYLLADPTIFDQISAYPGFARIAEELVWGACFALSGTLGLGTVLWCVRPGFLWRLLARMAVAFCLVSFALNNLCFYPPPLSTVTYLWLGAWSLLGVLRTKSNG